METSPPFEFTPEIAARVDSLIGEASASGVPFDAPGLAAELQASLDADGATSREPPDEKYWRLVLAALQRRAGLPV